jgi:predicted Fe-Mo cluster-binding NifX family protein
MKIALTSTGQNLQDPYDPRFGRCTYFIIYDTENQCVKALENKGQFSGGGAGIAAAQQMIDEDVNVILTGNMGPNAYSLMQSSGMKVYQCQSGTCQEILDTYHAGSLAEISEAGPSHMGMNSGR